jgi:hypothetical protein
MTSPVTNGALVVLMLVATSCHPGMAGASGVWSGLPVNVIYVPHDENSQSALEENKPQFQFMDGYNESGAYVGSGFEVNENPEYEALSIHDNMIIIFSRCPHLCCIPGWQLVANDFTSDQWSPGGADAGGNKLPSRDGGGFWSLVRPPCQCDLCPSR